MRILNGASRRGLDLHCVHAEAAAHDHQVTLVLDVNQKQVGQLYREWYSMIDVVHVGTGMGQSAWVGPHPPAGVSVESQRAAARA